MITVEHVATAGAVVGMLCALGGVFYKLGSLHKKVDYHDQDIEEMKERMTKTETTINEHAVSLGRIEEIFTHIKAGQQILFEKIDKFADRLSQEQGKASGD